MRKMTYNIEVKACVTITPVQEETPVNAKKSSPGGGLPGHGLGTPKSCSICGKEGFNKATHPHHGDGLA